MTRLMKLMLGCALCNVLSLSLPSVSQASDATEDAERVVKTVQLAAKPRQNFDPMAIVFQPSISLKLIVSSGQLVFQFSDAETAKLVHDAQTVSHALTNSVIHDNGAGVLPSER